MSRSNRPPLSLSKLICNMRKRDLEGITAVVIGTVTNDTRLYNMPKLNVCALHVIEAASARFIKGLPMFRSGFLVVPHKTTTRKLKFERRVASLNAPEVTELADVTRFHSILLSIITIKYVVSKYKN